MTSALRPKAETSDPAPCSLQNDILLFNAVAGLSVFTRASLVDAVLTTRPTLRKQGMAEKKVRCEPARWTASPTRKTSS